MTNSEKRLNLIVQITPDQIPELEEFLAERDPNFSASKRITIVADEAPDSAVMMGWQAGGKAAQINSFLQHKGLEPLLPEDTGSLSPEAIADLLQLAINQFSWDHKNRLEEAWWIEDGIPWFKVTGEYPRLFNP